jgi:Mn-dependent DtxR family transcriptional regulator
MKERRTPRTREAAVREWHREKKRLARAAQDGEIEYRTEVVRMTLGEGPASVKELAAKLGYSHGGVAAAVSRLAQAREIKRQGKSRWRLR